MTVKAETFFQSGLAIKIKQVTDIERYCQKGRGGGVIFREEKTNFV